MKNHLPAIGIKTQDDRRIEPMIGGGAERCERPPHDSASEENMATRYAYSFDRNTFYGSFATRQEAYYAGMTRLNSLTDQPEAIYVAERIQPDLQITGHASGLIREMRKRADIACGDSASGWLVNVTGQQVADLDEMLSQTIFAWLRKHELQPTFFMVEHISETAPLAEPKKSAAVTKEELSASNCSC